MNANSLEGLPKKKDSRLKIDEDIELDDNVRITETFSSRNEHLRVPEIKKSIKPTIAGYLLLITFFLNLLLPTTYFLLIYNIETATGETTLKGQIKDTENNPVANVSVSIVNSNLSTNTDIDGKYRFENIPVGEHEIRYIKAGYRQIKVIKTMFSKDLLSQNDETDNIIDIPGNLTSGISIDAFDGPHTDYLIIEDNFNGTISGKVTNLSDGALNNIQLHILGTNISTQTDDNGNYVLTNVTPGIITMELTQTEGKNKTTVTFLFASNKSTEFNITFNEHLDQKLDEVGNKMGNIYGTILDEDQKPVVNIDIVINIMAQESQNITTTSDNTGKFSFIDVPIGIHEIVIFGEDYYITNIRNISLQVDSNMELPQIVLTELKSPIKITEDIASEYSYYCIVILIIFSVITLAGAISALQRKRYSLVFVGAILGMVPVLLPIVSIRVEICLASIFCVISLVLVVFSRNEFSFETKR